MIKRLLLLFVFPILIFFLGCGEGDSSDSLNLPPDFDLTTSECPAEDIRDTHSLSEFAWLCINIDTNEIDWIGFLPTTFVSDCFSLESKADSWCLIAPTGIASFTGRHSVHHLQTLPRDENGCRVGETVELIEELECELVKH